MRKLILATLCLILTGCGITKPVQPTIIYRDSTRVEYRDRVVHDTVDVQLPDILQERTTPDTLSILENDYAKSTAVVHDGLLSHDLKVFPRTVKVPVTVEVHDTLIVQKQAETITEYVEVEKKLTKWQSLKMRLGGWVMLVLLGLVIFFAVRAFVLKKNLFR